MHLIVTALVTEGLAAPQTGQDIQCLVEHRAASLQITFFTQVRALSGASTDADAQHQPTPRQPIRCSRLVLD